MLVSNKIAGQHRYLELKFKFSEFLREFDISKAIAFDFDGIMGLSKKDKDILSYFGYKTIKKIREQWEGSHNEFDDEK
jgi:hypothetical protein